MNSNHCSNGSQDQPTAAFDYTTNPPTLWVGYRHQDCGLCNIGACIRRGFINSSGTLTWLGDSLDVQNLGGEGGGSTGAIRVQAGDGTVTIVYNNEDTTYRCPTTSTVAFAIESVTSFDNAVTWQSHTRLFHNDDTSWLPCVLSQQIDMGANFRNFDFVRAVDGTYYVIAQYDRERARLFMNRTAGVQPAGGSNPAGWSEFCVGTKTFDAGGAPVSNWTAPGVQCQPKSKWVFVHPSAPSDGGLGAFSLAWPTMAMDDVGRLVIWYYEGDATDQLVHVKVWSTSTPRQPTTTFDSIVATSDFRPTSNSFLGARILGDYEGMTARAYGAPVCGSPGTFYPVWIMADGGAVDAGSSITPIAQMTQISIP